MFGTVSLEIERNHVENVGSFLPTEDQVTAFAMTHRFLGAGGRDGSMEAAEHLRCRRPVWPPWPPR